MTFSEAVSAVEDVVAALRNSEEFERVANVGCQTIECSGSRARRTALSLANVCAIGLKSELEDGRNRTWRRRGDRRRRLPMTTRDVIAQTGGTRTATVAAQEISGDATLVQKP